MKKRHMGGHEISRPWYWMPTTILVLGILSIALLVWAYQISERDHANSEFIHAILDLRVRTASFHLWFEEAVVGGTRADLERSLSDLDLTTKLSDAILRGGLSEDGEILQPLDDSELRRHAGAVRTLLTEFRKIALERLQDPKGASIGSPLEEQFDVIHGRIQKTSKIVELRIKKKVKSDRMKSRGIFLGVTVVRRQDSRHSLRRDYDEHGSFRPYHLS